MQVEKMVLKGEVGRVTIEATEKGAILTGVAFGVEGTMTVDRETPNGDESEVRRVARWAATILYGEARASKRGAAGGPNCTGSMVYDIRQQIERVAGM